MAPVTRRELELGVMFDHKMLASLAFHAMRAEAMVTAIGELLAERGVVPARKLAARAQAVQAKLENEEAHKGLGLMLNSQDPDKYAITDVPDIDCAARVELCHGACCTMRFPLSRQDVEEGVVRFDVAHPYLNMLAPSGYCVHCDPDAHSCSVYEARPSPCRRYDCRQDDRIWLDFEGRVPNPQLSVLARESKARRTPAGESPE